MARPQGAGAAFCSFAWPRSYELRRKGKRAAAAAAIRCTLGRKLAHVHTHAPYRTAMASSSGGAGNGALGAGAEEAAEIEMIRKSPAFWAKLGHHPYWPAKVSDCAHVSGWV